MARIGMVNYINTAPIYEIWKEEVRNPDWHIVEQPPSTLNRMLAADELDMGFVSSYEYAARPDRYHILADLSISATGPVGSVFLFSHHPPTELDGSRILMTGQSDTSVYLLRLILEEFLGVRPDYASGDITGAPAMSPQPAGVLAIGDEALHLAMEDRYPYQLDLAEFWNRETGLPFVFAVFAVREEFVRLHEQHVRAIHQALLGCRQKGLARLDEICRQVAHRIPMNWGACRSYLQAMEYDLGDAKQQALERFFSLLIRRGEADPHALPLRIWP